MKLRRRNSFSLNNKTTILIISAIVLAVVVIGIVVGVLISNHNEQVEQEEHDKTVIGINVASKPDKDVYYVGEEFDPTGFLLQIVTNSGAETQFIEYNEDIHFTGFDSSVAVGNQTITVSYMNHMTTFVIQIKEAPKPAPKLEGIEVYNLQTTYTLSDWNRYGPDVRGIDFTGAKIRCIYSDGSVKEDILLNNSYIYGYTKLDAPGTTSITVKYSNGETTVETTVTITITE